MKPKAIEYHFFKHDPDLVIKELGKERLLAELKKMLLIRNFEIRAESAYLQGKVGGFFHSYMGQEAVQTAAVSAMGRQQWWITSYRCHALALLLDATPDELMAELFGKATGNAKGRGGSMHFFTDRLLGGFGIVGGQVPIATGAAFSMKYLKQEGVAVCFLGDGAVAQGAFHESLNIAALWNLPCIYVVENNQWGMGTAVSRALSIEPIAETKGPAYGMKAYTLDGMDFFNCYAGFKQAFEEVKSTKRPVLIEAVTERFRGHSISDPANYRTKDALKFCMERDPILVMFKQLATRGMLSDEQYQLLDKEQKEIAVASLKFAEESPWPDPITLGEDVFA
jgi:pyruvate dehydrogenase E1 component alpha subunit